MLPTESGAVENVKTLADYEAWFIGTVTALALRLQNSSVLILYQTDTRFEGRFVDKSAFCTAGAAAAGLQLLWRKVVLRAPVGFVRRGNTSAFSHLLCYARQPPPPGAHVLPDVFERGHMAWPRAMGAEAALAAARFVASLGETRIVDPFCGSGTVLAAANHVGLAALGVDLSPKRCRHAEVMQIVVGRDGGWRAKRSTDREPPGCEQSEDRPHGDSPDLA
jgi:hypothetical protein